MMRVTPFVTIGFHHRSKTTAHESGASAAGQCQRSPHAFSDGFHAWF